MFRQALALLVLVTMANGHQIKVVNGCSQTVWVGVLPQHNQVLPANGGFRLNEGENRTLDVPNKWGGSLWGRTGCDASGRCETGDCDRKLECAGAGGKPPMSLAEISFDGYRELDYYDVSVFDGYNLPLAMFPIPGSFVGDGANDCQLAGCIKDLNALCPEELQMKNEAGTVIACLPQVGNFPVCKEACPNAYCNPFDDTASTYTCKGASAGSSGYEVHFC